MWGLLLGISGQDIQMIHMRHEQAGVYAADAYARVTQSPGVCFGTAGPGMQNMAAGISQAYLARSPIVALFGQHSPVEDGLKGLQVGWGAEVVRTMTKWGLRIVDGNTIGYWVRRALRDSLTYPPGPVALDMPPVATLPQECPGAAIGQQVAVTMLKGTHQLISPTSVEPPLTSS